MFKERIGRGDPETFEDQLLYALISEVKSGSILINNLTDVFAKILLSGDMGLLNELGVDLPGGKSKTYASEISELKVKYDFAKTVRKMELSRSTTGEVGQTFYPGIITLSGPQKQVYLAHEYIHMLSFHKNSWVGIKTRGYKLMGTRN